MQPCWLPSGELVFISDHGNGWGTLSAKSLGMSWPKMCRRCWKGRASLHEHCMEIHE